MKYPIGIQTFEQIIEGGFVYVDKTDLVYAGDRRKVYKIACCFSSKTGTVSDFQVAEA